VRNIRTIFWIPVLFILATVTVVYLVRDARATPPEAGPLSPAACQTIDGIFRPTGIAGKEQLLKHLIDSSDRLATQTEGELQQAAQIHASYARRLYVETTGEGSAVPEQVHSEGLKAYDTIRTYGWKRCALRYLQPAPKGS